MRPHGGTEMCTRIYLCFEFFKVRNVDTDESAECRLSRRGGMDTSASAAVTAAAAGRNTTSSTPLVQSPTPSLVIFAFINSATTLLCACLTAICVLTGLGLAGYRRRRDQLLSDRLGVAATQYWSFEHDVERLLWFVTQNYIRGR